MTADGHGTLALSRARLWVRAGLLALVIAVPAHAAQDGDRWRLSEGDDDIKLYVAATDEATDHIGSPSFECDRVSGWVRVDALVGEEEQEELINLLRSDSHPIIKLGPDETDKAVLDSIVYSGLDGWHYRFGFWPTVRAFNEFRKTGIFEYEIGKAQVRSDYAPGVETIGKFQDLCRRAAKR